MINFLRIVNNIKIGDYLHSDGTINDIASPNVIGICVIPSNFFPDGYARFMSLIIFQGFWSTPWLSGEDQIRLEKDYSKALPRVSYQKSIVAGSFTGVGFLEGSGSHSHSAIVASPFLPNKSLNPEFLKDLSRGNIFQSYRGYENNRYYREQCNLKKKELPFIFETGFKSAPTYRKEDWYIPSIGELACIKCHDKNRLNSMITSDYWSSSEGRPDTAWFIGMRDGFVGENRKKICKSICNFLIL